MVASSPTHHNASPSPGSCAKVRLAASSCASSVATFLAWSSVAAMFSLLSLHNSVQGTMTENEPTVKVKCTSLCNNFYYGTKIRDEAQGRARPGDPPKDRRSSRGAAPDRGPCADHSERHSREGGGAEAHLLRPLPRTQGPLPGLYRPPPGAKPPAGPIPLGRILRPRGASKEGAIRGLCLLRRQRGAVDQ